MKKIIVFEILFFVFIVLYLNYDKKGYYYGLGCSFCNKNMPYGLIPKINSDYPQNFVLLDEDGFELAANGFRYRQSSFKIKNFLEYGYNDTSVIIKCTDSLNKINYLELYLTDCNGTAKGFSLSFKDLGDSEYRKIKDNYQWFEIDEEKASKIGFVKFVFIAGALLSLLFIFSVFFRLRNNKVAK